MALMYSDRVAETRKILGKLGDGLSDKQIQQLNNAIETIVAFGLKEAVTRWKNQPK